MKKNILMKIFSLSKALYEKKIPILPKFFWAINRIVLSSDIPYTANINESVKFGHNGLGTVVHRNASIGEGSLIMQNVTIGGNMGRRREVNGEVISSPQIGKYVLIGAGATIIGPVEIGDYSQIAAGAVVLDDIPKYGVAVGMPAKVIKILDEETAKSNVEKW